ncbi:MAG TPA: histidine phosphatase family protein [Mobilitalea sp.]|nr:histidine phosphatase family protein [Mobilitalea sp.]
MVNLYLIRHGRQNSTLCNVDVELSNEGRIQAELLRERLKNYDIDALYSSNLIRAKQTAEIINEALGLDCIVRDEIREISFGLMEGKSDEYNDEHFHDFKLEQQKLLEDVPYPGGENGTSVYERAMPVIQEIVQSGKKNIVVVTHGGTIRVLLAALFGRNQVKRFLFGVSLENTSITQLVYNPSKDRFYLERFNDSAHLEDHPKLQRRSIK